MASGKNVHTGILSIMQVENNRIRIFMQYITKNIRQSSFWHTVKKVLLALVLFNKNLQINICTGNKSEQLFPIHGNNNRIQHTTLFRVIHQWKHRNNTFITNSIMNVKKNPGITLCIFLSSSKMISIEDYVSICRIFQRFDICYKCTCISRQY